MTSLQFTSTNELDIQPFESSSQDDFDFLVGDWNVHNKKLKSRLSNCTEWEEFDATQVMYKVLTGLGNIDNMHTTIGGKPYEGMSIRLFNPLTKLWSIYWADNNLGTLEKPVVGSFDKNRGAFFSRETFKDKDIILQFQWDVSDPDKPVWSQAFSPDNGETWEWNWYMYFTRPTNEAIPNLNEGQAIKVIELRNYAIKPGERDHFIQYFEESFLSSQNELGGFTLGQYRVKEVADNFFWIRGFRDMSSRKKFLEDFYYGPFWKEHKTIPNSLLVNNDNVHLLKPLDITGDAETTSSINSNWFGKQKGIAVVDYFIANQKLDKLIDLLKSKYIFKLKDAGIENTSFWISETSPNDFTALPVFQDKDLLVSISFYKDELAYRSAMKLLEMNMEEELKNEMLDTVTIKHTLIIYPTEKSFFLKN